MENTPKSHPSGVKVPLFDDPKSVHIPNINRPAVIEPELSHNPKPKMNPGWRIIHAAQILSSDGKYTYLFLRKTADFSFTWFEDQSQTEKETLVTANTIEEALRLAAREWKKNSFRNVNCGFRYTLPERDEHGINALFHQMVSSYSSMNGIYYDDELGNNCFVQNASTQARDLWQRLKNQQRL
jgi:hypothetical protein